MNTMKNILWSMVTVALTGWASGTVQAQQKFAHINTNQLLQGMPEILKAEEELKKYGGELDMELNAMVTEYQTKLQDFQSKQSLMSEAVRQNKVKEITDLENRIKDFEESAQEDIMKKRDTLYEPILNKAKKAIEDVAKEKGYHFVLDTSQGAVIYAADSDNILAAVKTKLGLK